MTQAAAAPGSRADLQADCANCFALCCTVLRFDASADFAFDKRAGTACRHLDGFRCGIHDELRPRGFAGCVAYDCQGAGQKVSQVTFGGRDWHGDAKTTRWMVAVFPLVRQLHEILAYLVEAAGLPAAAGLRPEIEQAAAEVERLSLLAPEELLHVDVPARRAAAGPLLERASALARPQAPRGSRRNADLVGADLHAADLQQADLRGAYLIAADLRGADLRGADLLGTDLRDADLRGADLSAALFVTSSQLHAARGDAHTTLSAPHARPAHWALG